MGDVVRDDSGKMSYGPKQTIQQVINEEPIAEAKPAPESVAEPKLAAEKKADDVSDKWDEKFSRLTKLESKLRSEKQAMKAQAQELAELANFRKELAEDPARAIARLGVSPDSIFAEHAKQEAEKPGRELEQLKAEIRQEMQAFRESQHRSEMQRRGDEWDARFSSEFSAPDYAVVKAWDPNGDLVRQHVIEHYKESGEILTPTQALGIIKTELASKVEALKKAGIFGNTGEATEARKGVKAQQKTITTTADDYSSRRAPYLDDDADIERLTAKYAHLR